MRAISSVIRPAAAALGSAALIVLAAPGVLPWPNASLLAWLSFVPILLALERLGWRGAMLLGWATGALVQAGVSTWMPGVLARYSGIPAWAAVAVSAGIWMWGGLAWALWAAGTRAVRVLPWGPVASASLFVSIEYGMPLVFPYSIGLTQYRNTTIAQAAEWGGPSLLAFLMVLGGAAVAGLIRYRARRWKLAAATVAAALLLLAGGRIRLASIRTARQAAPVLRVGVVQAGHAQTGWKARPEDSDLLERYQALSASLEAQLPPPELLVWPEKAYPLLLRRDADHDYPEGHGRRIRRGFRRPLVFGANAVDANTRELTNAALLLRENGRFGGIYDKVRLIPYSEWLPSWLEGRIPGGRRYRAGARLAPLILHAGTNHAVRLGTFICFESAFSSHVGALMAQGPELLLNLSDDTWFGASTEPEQHLSQVVFRAIESRRDVVRSAGAGISALVAATGEIEQRLPVQSDPGGRGMGLILEARLLRTRTFVSMSAMFPWLCALTAAAALADAWRRSRRSTASRQDC